MPKTCGTRYWGSYDRCKGLCGREAHPENFTPAWRIVCAYVPLSEHNRRVLRYIGLILASKCLIPASKISERLRQHMENKPSCWSSGGR